MAIAYDSYPIFSDLNVGQSKRASNRGCRELVGQERRTFLCLVGEEKDYFIPLARLKRVPRTEPRSVWKEDLIHHAQCDMVVRKRTHNVPGDPNTPGGVADTGFVTFRWKGCRARPTFNQPSDDRTHSFDRSQVGRVLFNVGKRRRCVRCRNSGRPHGRKRPLTGGGQWREQDQQNDATCRLYETTLACLEIITFIGGRTSHLAPSIPPGAHMSRTASHPDRRLAPQRKRRVCQPQGWRREQAVGESPKHEHLPH